MDLTSEQVEPLFRKLGNYLDLDDRKRTSLLNLMQSPVSVAPDTTILRQGATHQDCGVLLSGWAIQYKTLSDGRRQVVNFLLPGTFIGLQATVFDTSDHSITTLTDCGICWFSPHRMLEFIKDDPILGMTIFWDRTQEEAILMERLASLGQRSARERMAHILIELWYRLDMRGLDNIENLPFPVGQSILADLLGLTSVHTNRTLKTMQRENLIDYSRNTVRLINLKELVAMADFDLTYMHSMPMSKETRDKLEAMLRRDA